MFILVDFEEIFKLINISEISEICIEPVEERVLPQNSTFEVFQIVVRTNSGEVYPLYSSSEIEPAEQTLSAIVSQISYGTAVVKVPA